MGAHAVLSPSKAAMWLNCPGSIAMCSHLPPQKDTAASKEGTAAHRLAELCLTTDSTNPQGYIGMVMENGVPVTEEMATEVQKYLDLVRGIPCDALLVEQELSLEAITQEDGAIGTADAVLLAGKELIIVDLKYGKGQLVEAEGNPQLRIYALAAALQFEALFEFETVRVVIAQPRRDNYPEDTFTIDELMGEFRLQVMDAAEIAFDELLAHQPGAPPSAVAPTLIPGEAQCKWCTAGRAGRCPALDKEVSKVTEIVFDNLDASDAAALLNEKGKKLELVKQWVTQTEQALNTALHEGTDLPDFKLVIGKAGNRKWANEAEVEEMLKGMKVPKDYMYERKLISPTTAEALAKEGTIGKRQWPRLQELITRSEGKPIVVAKTDKRPAWTPTEIKFDNLEEPKGGE